MEIQFQWETVDQETDRAEVAGGWIIRSRWVGYKADVENMVFIKDSAHEWKLKKDAPFTWETVENDTSRGEVAGGWLVRVRWATFRSDAESMVFVPDPDHEWRIEKSLRLKWEPIESNTDRAKVHGGWFVRGRWGALRSDVESMTFMPDPDDQWQVSAHSKTGHLHS